MTEGFIDSASVQSALVTLWTRGDQSLSPWDRQCLLDTTYMLLFRKVGIVPGPSSYRGASGLFAHVTSQLPSLEEGQFNSDQALRSTKRWLTKNPAAFQEAWDRLRAQPEFPAWAAAARKLTWLHHVQMHTSLFNPDFVPHIAPLLGVSEEDLRRIHAMSQDERTVRLWIETNLTGEAANLANDAHFAAGLIRGKVHEYIASGSGLHLAGHPFRKPIERPLKPGQGEPVYNSEEYFVKIIIGSALLETTDERRTKAWVENIVKARRGIELRRVALPDAAIGSDAERLAAEAARACGISASYSRIRRELEITAALVIGGVLALAVSPWAGPVGPIVTAAYRHRRGASIGDDLGRFLLDTTARFRRLARSVPGRIVRLLRGTQWPPRGG